MKVEEGLEWWVGNLRVIGGIGSVGKGILKEVRVKKWGSEGVIGGRWDIGVI